VRLVVRAGWKNNVPASPFAPAFQALICPPPKLPTSRSPAKRPKRRRRRRETPRRVQLPVLRDPGEQVAGEGRFSWCTTPL